MASAREQRGAGEEDAAAQSPISIPAPKPLLPPFPGRSRALGWRRITLGLGIIASPNALLGPRQPLLWKAGSGAAPWHGVGAGCGGEAGAEVVGRPQAAAAFSRQETLAHSAVCIPNDPRSRCTLPAQRRCGWRLRESRVTAPLGALLPRYGCCCLAPCPGCPQGGCSAISTATCTHSHTHVCTCMHAHMCAQQARGTHQLWGGRCHPDNCGGTPCASPFCTGIPKVLQHCSL